MKKSLLKNFSRTLLVLACCLVANNAWADDAVYSLVGNNADIFGAAWYTENENTVMSPSSNNVYTWTNPKFPIRSNNWGVQYKVIKNHDYEQGQWPNGNGNNANYTINDPGWYSMTFTFELNNNNVYASVTRLGDVCTVAGATNGEGSANVDDPFFGKTWKTDANEMSTNDYTNYIWTSAPVELSRDNSVAFKVVKNNSEWIGNNGANIVCTAEEAGTYLLKVTYNSNNGTPSGELIAVPTTTLSNLCQSGVDGKIYTISDENGLRAAYKNGNTVWFKDEIEKTFELTNETLTIIGGSVNLDVPGNEQNYWIENKRTKDFDQSNWIEVVFPENLFPGDLLHPGTDIDTDKPYVKVKNLTGIFTKENGRPRLEVLMAVASEDVTVTEKYEPNPYIPANFYGSQQGYFFSKPKVQEYAKVVDAKWDGTKMVMGDNNAGFKGSFTIKPVEGLTVGYYYTFHGIINRSIAGGDESYSTPRLQAEGDYDMITTDLAGQAGSERTAISTVGVNGEVKSVKYVNVAGVVSDRPFQGVNIVVTEYTDGTRTTAKVVK